jgi:hypothetical protein
MFNFMVWQKKRTNRRVILFWTGVCIVLLVANYFWGNLLSF